MAAVDRVFEILDTEPDVTERPDAHRDVPFTGRVRFEDVSFGYKPERLVLKDDLPSRPSPAR